jgi:hypothetical protein
MNWQVFGVGVSTVISALGIGLIVWKTDPITASPLLKALFFIALFFLVWGSSTLIIFSIKNRGPKPRPTDESTSETIFNTSLLMGLIITIIGAIIISFKKFLKQ